MRRFALVIGLLSLSCAVAFAQAQSDDAAYCAKLSNLAYKYVGGAGGDGRSFPDLNVQGAIEDCNKGRYDKAIPYLEKRLRDSRVTLPAR